MVIWIDWWKPRPRFLRRTICSVKFRILKNGRGNAEGLTPNPIINAIYAWSININRPPRHDFQQPPCCIPPSVGKTLGAPSRLILPDYFILDSRLIAPKIAFSAKSRLIRGSLSGLVSPRSGRSWPVSARIAWVIFWGFCGQPGSDAL